MQAQIKERIKIGLALGELRPGATLPSIRDLEQQLGAGRAIIRNAYLDLQESGILDMKHGRRADRHLKFFVQPYSELKNFYRSIRSKTYKLVLIGNRIWDHVPKKLRNIKTISHPRLEVDRTSLEKARVKAGIVV